MALFNFKWKKDNDSSDSKRTRRPLKVIQAAVPEGASYQTIIESMLTGNILNVSVPGTTTAYKNYDSQVAETYKKYNGHADYGNTQIRAIIDLRTAMIAGEGISVSCPNSKTAEWIDNFLTVNDLQGESFINLVKGSELAGQALIVFKSDINPHTGELYTKTIRVPYLTTHPYKAIYTDPLLREEVDYIKVKKDGIWQRASIGRYVYVRTGGDDADTLGPTTRAGVILTDAENYDRASRDIRRLNHILARITPVFETSSPSETNATKQFLNNKKWKIGEVFIGQAKMSYATPGGGAHDNLIKELVTSIKTITAVTGVPVHWLGFVDLMSNRATAESLYELIKHATILERVTWQKSLYQLILYAQEQYIDSGGRGLLLDPNFEVKLPLIDFSNFKEKVEAYSLAYSDQAISLDDYRSGLPGIDPLKTAEAIDAEEQQTINRLVKSGKLNNSLQGDEDGET